ncbi:uncharacterized protein [Euphorbia lathyris]|uniref:uncharacterized protein isoform X1 n=1 Tax=Euphorbia lathyris TaxID=212925 RepID=UPI003314440A
MGLSCFACFDGGSKRQRQEEERLASAEARAKAAEAAQKSNVYVITIEKQKQDFLFECVVIRLKDWIRLPLVLASGIRKICSRQSCTCADAGDGQTICKF